jgi:tetratricopeptide (TPR) repeat protein
LAEHNKGRPYAQVAWAWQAILEDELLGSKDNLRARAKEALALAKNEKSPTAWAARAGLRCVEGDLKGAMALIEHGSAKYPDEPRIKLVRIWTLCALNRSEEIRELVTQISESAKNYIPLFLGGISAALKIDARKTALNLTEKLSVSSPEHLYGSLAAIALALPSWGKDGPKADQVATLLSNVGNLESQIKTAPPKLARLGHYLLGRVYMMAGRLDEAVSNLEMAIGPDSDQETLAWYARAVAEFKGAKAALDMLKKNGATQGPAVYDIQAQALLDSYQIDVAADVIDKLKSEGTLPDREKRLRWLLAIRRGETSKTLAFLPDVIDPEQRWEAIEMYYSLASAGNRDGVEKLVAALKQKLPACSDAMESWHNPDTRKAMAALTRTEGAGDDPCIDALAGRLLFRHVPPTSVKEATQRALKASVGNLQIAIDHARAVWLADGKDAAIALLNNIFEQQPQGAPILLELANAYLDLGMPERSSEILTRIDTPESLALQIAAARQAGDETKANELVVKAIARHKADPSPALAFYDLEAQLDAGRFPEVVAAVEAELPKAGSQTAEIAEIGARALNSMAKRSDADRLLTQAAKTALDNAGQGESWEVNAALIRLNLRRGGTFMYKALSLINEMIAQGVRDREVFFSFAIIHAREGNERGTLRYLREALNLDPSYTKVFQQLSSLGKLNDEFVSIMNRTVPGYKL